MKLTKENLRACFKNENSQGLYECIVQPQNDYAVLMRNYRDLELLISRILNRYKNIELIEFYPSCKKIQFEEKDND